MIEPNKTFLPKIRQASMPKGPCLILHGQISLLCGNLPRHLTIINLIYLVISDFIISQSKQVQSLDES
jgi:hypothetical protein